MLRFQLQVLLHHWRVGVKILKRARKITVSMFLNFNELYFLLSGYISAHWNSRIPAFIDVWRPDNACMAGNSRKGLFRKMRLIPSLEAIRHSKGAVALQR